ncbi:MAG: M14 family zinc carboxypeptidase [Sphingomonadales bacterium]|jgi:hypothetical protein
MRVFKIVVLFFALVASNIIPAMAQEGFFPDATYDPAIPTPEAYLGHEIGDILVRYDQVIGYLQLLAERSDRITIETIGYSHERRPIKRLIITHPDNHARLSEIKAEHLRLANPQGDAPVSENMPVVTWINYGVHGDEISGIEAVLGIAYHLAAVQDAEWIDILRNSVILNIATFNPDGRDRSATWYNMHHAKVPVSDPAHREHSIPWPGGRTNHYWFDLNRQWLPLTQPESQAWIKVYHDWKPNVVVDFHEMGSDQTYYFHPGEEGRTHPLVPVEAEALLERLSTYPAKQLDSEARPYFTKEVFDNYYIGKGSTFPLVTGGVGMLFEQSGSEGITIDSDNGPQFYRENIRQHMNSGLSVIRGAYEMRGDFLRHQKAFFKSALDTADRADVKAYVFAAPRDPKRVEAFLTLLKRHQIKAYGLNKDVSSEGLDFRAGEAFVVPAKQAQYRLIRGMFDKLTQFPRDSFYDISGWTLPFAYGLDFATLSRLRSNLLGEEWFAPTHQASPPAQGAVAYVMAWDGYYAPRALYRLLDAGVRARATTRPMEVDTPAGRRSFRPGAIVISPGNNDTDVVAKLPALFATIAEEDGISVQAATAGLTPNGPDLGGSSQIALHKPKVAMMTGDGMGAYDAGELWYLLDYRMEMPVVLRDGQDFDGLNLAAYTHFILPDGTPPLNERQIAILRNWVATGGTLIATQDAAGWAAENGFGNAKVLKEEENNKAERLPFAQRSENEARRRIAGAVFVTDADVTHPIAFGLTSARLPVHRDMEGFFQRHEDPYATVAAYGEDPLISGYASEEDQRLMAGTPAIIAERFHAGSVILFADNPAFRGYWYGTNKLVLNAIFFSKGF